jgi:hypothetical protein
MSSLLRRTGARLTLAGAGVALLLAHLWFWYAPRERAAPFGDRGLSREWVASPPAAVALWLPYPHQNLALLADSAGDRRAFLAALFRSVGAEAPLIPRFGPLTLPPSHEMVVAVDAAGDRLLVSCRVYPTLALFARLAGLVAGNPWLSGGSVTVGRSRATVSWDGFRWTVASDSEQAPERRAGDGEASTEAVGEPLEDGSRALAALWSQAAPEPLPAGIYTLERRDGGLEIRHGPRAAERFDAPWTEFSPPGMLLVERETRVEGAARGWGLFAVTSAAAPALPDLVTLTRGPIEPREIGALSVLRGLGFGGNLLRVGEWEIVALTEDGLTAAAAMVPELERALDGPEGERLMLAGALDLQRARDLLDSSIDLARELPLIPGRYRTALTDARTLTAPLAGFDRATLEVHAAPSVFVLRLHRTPGSH